VGRALARDAVAKARRELEQDHTIKLKMSGAACEPALMLLVDLWIRVRAPRNPKTIEKTRPCNRLWQKAGRSVKARLV
jgi:hypothetical protein